MRALSWLLVTIAVTGVACSERSPLAPAAGVSQRETTVGVATLRGWVYARAEGDDPALVDAVIEVRAGDGATETQLTDSEGFYAVALRPGRISITASKEGYEAKTWQLVLSNDTVLNFGLAPR